MTSSQLEPTQNTSAGSFTDDSQSVLSAYWDTVGWNEDYLVELREIAQCGFTKDSDWAALQHIIRLRLKQNLAYFLCLPSHKRCSRILDGPQLTPDDGKAGTSLSSDANATTTENTMASPPKAVGPGGALEEDDSDPIARTTSHDHDQVTSHDDLEHPTESLEPSTQGGLVLPPFPPFKRNRTRARTDSDTTSPASAGSSHGPLANPLPFVDPLYDEQGAIGGRILPAAVGQDEAKCLLEKVYKLMDEFEEQPPFTVQRLCELVAHPTLQHTSVGKYLRAVERVLLVTTPFSPAPPPSTSGADADPTTIAPGSGNPLVPPAFALEKPLFQPIPFLMREGEEGESGAEVAGAGFMAAAVHPGALKSQQQDTVDQNSHMEVDSDAIQGSGRHPSTIDPSNAAAPPVITTTPAVTTDPSGSEPFLGRVDEMDAGPLSGNGSAPPSRHHLTDASSSQETPTGVVAHGLNEAPQALSSTTDLSGRDFGAYREAHDGESEAESDHGSVTTVASTDTESTFANDDAASTGSLSKRRRVSRLPRTTSTQSLRERFVSSGMELVDPAKEEDKRLAETDGSNDSTMMSMTGRNEDQSDGKEPGTITGGPGAGSGHVHLHHVKLDDEAGSESSSKELPDQGHGIKIDNTAAHTSEEPNGT